MIIFVVVKSPSCVHFSATPTDCCTPGFPVLHWLLELTQTLVHWVDDAIQPSHCHPPSVLPSLFPSIRAFSLSQLVTSGGQSIGASALISVLPMNIQGWFPLGLTGLICLLLRDSQVSSPAPQFKNISSLVLSLLYGPTLTFVHDYWITTIALTIWTFILIIALKNLLDSFLSTFICINSFNPQNDHMI